jgi:ABC-type branched-subunit amino acid transport system substrate-binding protein
MYPFAKEYYKKYKTYPGSHGASSYTGVDVLIRSVKNAGDVETEKVIKAMENLKFKDTMFGDFYFRKHDHQGVSPVFVGKVIKDKELRYGLKLEETIDNPTGFLVPDDPKSTGCKF